jgi:EAL domain-containing protein (putative c-di-GMP-specific phosphodiesterase class I)
VDGLGLNPEDEVIATTIISLARALELEVVAEGVENQIQLDLIRELGSDYGQGNLFGQPMTIGDTERSFISPRRPHAPVITTP